MFCARRELALLMRFFRARALQRDLWRWVGVWRIRRFRGVVVGLDG